jgi:multicomponent Na+:H+ antiporter subunit D
MTSWLLHPVLPYVVAAALVPAGAVWLRRLVSLAAPVVALVLLQAHAPGTELAVSALGHDWVLLRVDSLARVFALAFILYSLVAGVYAWTDTGAGAKAAALGLAGAGVGVVLAGDLLSLFFFWEWLTVSSLFLIWLGDSPGSRGAGFRYLLLHVAGAMVMLMGILMNLAEGGGGAFAQLPTDQASSWLILIGMLTNAAVPPLHAWLSDAYPRASVYGTVFLAAFTTKSAVYALARGFPGVELLVWAGAIMTLYGVVYAILEDDIRRLLAYQIISQVGYMVAGIGLGTALALNGASAHAFAHVFYKGLLMMAAGAVIYATGRGRLSELGQLARPLKWTLIFMMIGAFSIAGMPFFSGFVSKSMIISAAAEAHRAPIELILLTASMGTVLLEGLRLPWFTFFGEDHGARVLRRVPPTMYLAMGLAALVSFVTGVVPGATLYAVLPYVAQYNPFTAHHFLEMVQLFAGTAVAFWILRPSLAGRPLVTLDVDYLYRGALRGLVDGAGAALENAGRVVHGALAAGVATAWRELVHFQEQRAMASVAVQITIVVAAVAGAAGLALAFYR